MPNIKFNYRYRDSGNYKNNGFIVFSNAQSIKLEFLDDLIKSKLIDELFFYASKWNIPNLFFANANLESDPTWHELESIEYQRANKHSTKPSRLYKINRANNNDLNTDN